MAYDRSVYKQLLQLFTGGGKTVIFASVRSFYGFRKRVLILVHTEELALQATQKLRVWNPGAAGGIEMAYSYALTSDTFVVASVATLGRAGSTRLSSFDPDEFDAVIVDEAHHAVADSYQRILRHFGFGDGLDCNRRLLLCVTATTKRGDGQGLDKVCDEIVFEFSMLKAIREGWQVNFKPFRVRTETKLDNVNIQNEGELSLAVNTPKRNAEIVAKWLEVGEQLKTIGFTVDIAHAQGLAEAFKLEGIKAEAVWGTDPERAWKLARHRGPEAVVEYCIENNLPIPTEAEIQELLLLVLLNCGMLIEGYDDPEVACVILARPTGSSTMLEQQIGRGGRLPVGFNNLIEARAAGIFIPKEYCVLIDVTDNTLRHKLAGVASLVGLPPKINMRGMMLTEVIDQVEALKGASPETDFDGLEDLDNIQSYIESVDLFKYEFSPEVMEHSELQWHKTPKGNYLLLLPNNERITIVKNLLDTWTISGTIRGSTFQDSERDVPSALRSADKILKTLGRILIPGLKRENTAKTGKAPASEAQIVAITAKLNRMKKAHPDFTKLTHHEASKMLTALYMSTAA